MAANLFTIQSPVALITSRLLRLLQVRVTDTTINKKLLDHPDYPSLLSVSDALQEWKVNNVAARIPKENLSQLPLPFVAQVYSGGEHFVLVTEVTDTLVQYAEDDGKVAETTLAAFVTDWSGVALLAEKGEDAGEKDFIINRRKERWMAMKVPAIAGFLLLLAVLAVVSFSAVSTSAGTIGYALLLLLALAGAGVTTLLLWYETDSANPALQKICTAGAKTNCNAILNSRHAKVLPWMSWSEAGFFYFSAGFTALLIAGFISSFQLLSLIVLLNVAALPYVLFSLYYQGRVAKQWCVLCLSVQALLLLGAMAAFTTGLLAEALRHLPPVESYLVFGLDVISVAGGWYMIKPLLLSGKGGKQNRHELARLKANPQIWEALLVKQKKIEHSTDGLGITLGNPAATHTLIKVCNPYCGPCAKAHAEIENLLDGNENLKVQILFTATNSDQDVRTLPVKHLLAIAGAGNEELTKKALDDWYLTDTKDYSVFANKYPMNGEPGLQGEKIEAMSEWCRQTDIAFTPTFFINKHQLPEIYSLSDLRYLLL